jgi:phosphohistidine phosphatase SixA
MQHLMILRHAKAVPWQPGVEDFPRALNDAGRSHAARIAHWISEHLELPEQILCSPAQRTRETLAPLLALQPELETRTSFVPQIYGASTHTLTKILDNAFTTSDRVLIVGHNPGFEMLAFGCSRRASVPDQPSPHGHTAGGRIRVGLGGQFEPRHAAARRARETALVLESQPRSGQSAERT